MRDSIAKNVTRLSSLHIHCIGAVIAVALIVGSIYTISVAYRSRQSGIQTTMHELTQVTDQLATAQRDHARVLARIDSLRSILNRKSNYVQSDSINELAVRLVAMIESNGLELEQFDPVQGRVVQGNAVQPITLRLIAPYKDILDWINQLHETMPDIHVVAISIRPSSPNSELVTSEIRLNWYNPIGVDVEEQ